MLYGLVVFTTLDAAEQFRQTVITEVERCLEERGKEPVGRLAEFIERHAMGNERIVVRPDGSAMITERIKDALVTRHGAPAPAGKHVVAHETLGNCLGAVLRQHASKKQMAGVRGDYLSLALVAV